MISLEDAERWLKEHNARVYFRETTPLHFVEPVSIYWKLKPTHYSDTGAYGNTILDAVQKMMERENENLP